MHDTQADERTYGTPAWKPISETRHARIVTEYVVECPQCEAGGHGGIYERRFKKLEEAKKYKAKHDATHDKNLAECCMWATGCVCRCGNVLV